MIKQTYRVAHKERDFYNELTLFDGGTLNKNFMIFEINNHGYKRYISPIFCLFVGLGNVFN